MMITSKLYPLQRQRTQTELTIIKTLWTGSSGSDHAQAFPLQYSFVRLEKGADVHMAQLLLTCRSI